MMAQKRSPIIFLSVASFLITLVTGAPLEEKELNRTTKNIGFQMVWDYLYPIPIFWGMALSFIALPFVMELVYRLFMAIKMATKNYLAENYIEPERTWSPCRDLLPEEKIELDNDEDFQKILKWAHE